MITFENVIPDEKEYKLNFEIHQRGNPEILTGKLPLMQPIFESTDVDTIGIAFNFLQKEKIPQKPPLNNIHGFSLFQQSDGKFLFWFSPEKLLQNWWKEHIECEIQGDFRKLLDYKILYVEKATKQSIVKRLTEHSTFQDILSLESPVTKLDLPANEIAILCFEFQDNMQIQTFGSSSDVNEMVSALRGDNFPDQERIFLDAEKALIKAMKPGYNKELFNNYPRSDDGLFNFNYNAISYTFMDPITLIYNQGKIVGGLSSYGGDAIFIQDNKEFELIIHENDFPNF